MKIGIDLDNTIIHYDDAFVRAAHERELLPPGFKGTKQQVRDLIRTLPDGEIEWQKLQGYVYGKGLGYAGLFDGVSHFISESAKQGHELYIVSHKTEFGHFDPERVNLRDAARKWLAARGLFSAISEDHVYFFPTREEKVGCIASLAPDWFIDDLIEVYEEPNFPAKVKKILFHTAPEPAPKGDWLACTDWNAITSAVLK